MGNNKLTINQWAEEDRPREKMMQHGAAALSNAELLAILIGSGNTEDSAVELMRKVLGDYRNSLSELGKTTIDELCRYKGRSGKGDYYSGSFGNRQTAAGGGAVGKKTNQMLQRYI